MHTDLRPPEKEVGNISSETDRLIDIQLIQQLYAQAYPLTFAFPAVVAILAYILSPYISTTLLVVWVGTIFLLSILRYYLSKNLRRQNDNIENPQQWEKKYFFLELFAGLSVGMSTGFANQVEPIYQMLIFLLTIGTCTGAVAILSPSFKISMAYLSSAVLIATFWLVYFQQPFFSAIALLLMFYFSLMILTSKRLNATLRRSLELGLKNHALVQEIQTKNNNLIESEKIITEALQARSHFLANISHEVRTPLNAIMGTLDILRREKLAEKNRDLVDVAYNSSEHLL
ncbi:MAG: hypothetical protein OEX19_17540, partial [Gammaproteobacteria bacterium]|nr:hypothetical protein [Gammaproteobacteria bacterium]